MSRGGTLGTVFAATGDAGSYRAQERVTGGYVMTELALGERTTLLPGIRFEATHTVYGAPQYRLGAGGAVTGRIFSQGTNDYLNILPGIHLRHLLFANTPLRVSFSRSLARPNYSDLAPFALQDVTALTISRGNPNLKVTTSNNFDVSLEHYFSSVGIVSAGYFYKSLNDYIYATTLQQTIGTDLYRISEPNNGKEAHVQGFETTLVRQLDFLPKALQGVSVYANYTHTSSEAILPRGSFILPGQAADMGNASVAYNRRGFSARASWNFQGKYVLAIGGAAADDNWLDNRLQMDFSASQKIWKHARVFIDLLNINNEPYRVYQGTSSARFIQDERYKMWLITGLKLDF
jgi:TonB-dependent receptor